MKTLVLGANGQLGREWLHFLSDRNIPNFGASSAEGDITQPALIAELLDRERPDVVVNCAAYTKVDKAESEPERAFLVNGWAVGKLAEACAERKIKLVHYSTDYVFAGNRDDAAFYPKGYPEDHAYAPINTYGASKADGERRLAASGCEFLLIRVAWLCGAHGPNFVKTMLKLGAERPEVRVVADQRGAPSFADNVVANTWTLLHGGCTGTWHIASRDATSWYALAAEAIEQAGLGAKVIPILTEEYPTPALRPAYSRLDVSKLSGVEGVWLESWKESLERIIPYVRT
jgi:dTDP-4-dehydrorhamnose reductase